MNNSKESFASHAFRTQLGEDVEQRDESWEAKLIMKTKVVASRRHVTAQHCQQPYTLMWVDESKCACSYVLKDEYFQGMDQISKILIC